MSETDRRGFLRISRNVGFGLIVGLDGLGVAMVAGEVTRRATGMQSGNANEREVDKQYCGSSPSQQCLEQRDRNTVGLAVVRAPLREEVVFRAVPSVALDTVEYRKGRKKPPSERPTHPLKRLIYGRDRVPPTRREVIAGVTTAVLFGAAHNLKPTLDGFATDSIPVEQTVLGGALWYDQRKFGMPANVAAHSAINAIATFFGKR